MRKNLTVIASERRERSNLCEVFRKDCFVVALLLLAMTAFVTLPALAADKNWSGEGDAVDWADDQNWTSWGVPSIVDDVAINFPNAAVDASRSFNAHSITLGANRHSTLTVEDFITGTVAPSSASDAAVVNYRQGKLVLKGSAGKVTLKGKYKEADQVLAEQPSLIFYAE